MLALDAMKNKRNIYFPMVHGIDIPIQPDLILIELYDVLSYFIFLPSD